MTEEALAYGIARLIERRRKAHGDEAEQARINAKLTKCYDAKWVMQWQQQRQQQQQQQQKR